MLSRKISNLLSFQTCFKINIQISVQQQDNSTMIQTPTDLLRQHFMNVQSVSINSSDLQYIHQLKQLGLKYHSSLFPSIFNLKNGLIYPGMATTHPIGPKEVLVEVPEALILSSIKAIQSPNLSDVFDEPFYHEQGNWQDRVLITYLLYLYSIEDKSSIFYHMLEHMSKDIDICCFWNEQELDLFRDVTIKTAALNQLKIFHEQWDLFTQVQAKHPILQHHKITKENYKWMLVHVSSRCFGKYLDFTSFVPFCEFFNHQVSSVDYSTNTVMIQNPENNQESDEISSNGTDDSIEYIYDGEFAYDEIDPISILWGSKQCLNMNPKEKKQIKSKCEQIMEVVEQNIDWNDFGILYVGRVIERVKIIENEYIAGRKNYKLTMQSLQQIAQMNEIYLKYVIAFYKAVKPKAYKYNKKQEEKKLPQKQFIRPDPTNYKPNYSQFYLKTNSKDNFKPNQQVYFCYGRNSNRTLLMRYGFAIQGNKYEHVWVSYDLSLPLKHMPDVLEKVQSKGLSLKRKYKIKHTQINQEIIIFHRLCSWNLFNIRNIDEIFYINNITKEINVLQEVKDSLKDEIAIYQGNNDLTDPDISYHQYFARVYHRQKIRILGNQIVWLSQLQTILKRVDKDEELENIMEQFTPVQNRVFKKYLENIVLKG